MNGLTEKAEIKKAAKEAEFEKIRKKPQYYPPVGFEPAIGTPDPKKGTMGGPIIIRTQKEAEAAGFNHAKIRDVCNHKLGRQSSDGYIWRYLDPVRAQMAKENGHKSQVEKQGKPIVGYNPDTQEIVRFPSRCSAEAIGSVSNILTSLKSKGGVKADHFYWYYDGLGVDPVALTNAVDRGPKTIIVRTTILTGLKEIYKSVRDAVGHDGVTMDMVYRGLKTPGESVCNGKFTFEQISKEQA